MSKRIITIDIETLPIEAAPESNLFWEDEKGFLETATSGALGRLLCIGYSEFDERGTRIAYGCFGWREGAEDFEPDERVILSDFWRFMASFDTYADTLIGHNLLAFDLPFIIQRSIVHNIRPSVELDLYKYQKKGIFDTMLRWDCWVSRPKGSTSLKKLAYALGLKCPKSADIDGSKIYEAYCAGRFREIYTYCMRDVKTTRNVWRKMKYIYPAESQLEREIALAK